MSMLNANVYIQAIAGIVEGKSALSEREVAENREVFAVLKGWNETLGVTYGVEKEVQDFAEAVEEQQSDFELSVCKSLSIIADD